MKDYIIGGYQPMEIKLSQEQRDRILRELSGDLTGLITNLRRFKPNDKTDLDRRFAIAITEVEKLDAYITQYILAPIGNND